MRHNSNRRRTETSRVVALGLLVIDWKLARTSLPDRSCLIRPLLLLVLTGRKSLNQEMSGSGLPLAAQSIVAVRVRSTTFNWGPMSIVGKPAGSWSSETQQHPHHITNKQTGIRYIRDITCDPPQLCYLKTSSIFNKWHILYEHINPTTQPRHQTRCSFTSQTSRGRSVTCWYITVCTHIYNVFCVWKRERKNVLVFVS